MSPFANALRHVASRSSEILKTLILAASRPILAVMKTSQEIELQLAHRDWNRCYVIRQRQQGIPSRRAVAEAIMQVVMTTAPSSNHAKEILRQAGIVLRSEQNRDGTGRYTKSGIFHRWERLHYEFET